MFCYYDSSLWLRTGKRLKVSISLPQSKMSDSLNVFISGFPRSYGERELAELAGAYGEIVNCKVLRGALICVCGGGLPGSFVRVFALVFCTRCQSILGTPVKYSTHAYFALFWFRLVQFISLRLAAVHEKSRKAAVFTGAFAPADASGALRGTGFARYMSRRHGEAAIMALNMKVRMAALVQLT